MKLAIIHHHFDSGGVTSVVLGQLYGISQLAPSLRPSQILLLHGGRAGAIGLDSLRAKFPELKIEQCGIDRLEYDERFEGEKQPQVQSNSDLARVIEDALKNADFTPDETILHVHNPTLGKSVALPGALKRLAANGWALLLQIHDFAEDLRPRNLARLFRASGAKDLAKLTGWLYPQGDAIHYATLSTKDACLLRERIVPSGRLHVVPNPIVRGSGPLPDQTTSRREINRLLELDPASEYVLYPVRGIQRKNIGEILFLSMLLGPGFTFSITLPPTTPIELASWNRWQRWGKDLHLPVIFGSGLHPEITLQQNRAAADRIVSTSVAEGFGLAFLESWLMERSVVGRDLPGVTDDFREAGVLLDSLYTNIRLPLSREDKLAALADNQRAHRLAWNALPDAVRPRHKTDSDNDADRLDFAELTPRWQYRILHKMSRDPGFANATRALNGALIGSFDMPVDNQLISDNCRQVASEYSPKKIAEGLVSIYQNLVQQPRAVEPVCRCETSVVQLLSAQSTYYPLRTEAPIEDEPFTRLSKPLEAMATNTVPSLPPLADIRAVVFDIYGTLVISGSGEVGTADRSPRSEALAQALESLEIEIDESPDAAVERLHRIIFEQQQVARTRGVEYPEVDIFRVWKQWLDETTPHWKVDNNGLSHTQKMLHIRLAEEFEARANPCHTMPNAAQVIRKLADRGTVLGIVSNAQAFTQTMYQAALQNDWYRMGFDRDLSFFSYRFGHGKPGTTMYKRLSAGLARRGISASEALFVGNDMLNDVAAAASCGLRTALFAGDGRSLRWREKDPRVATVQPDVVITELTQLLDVVQLA